jgi:hypothetical protein
MPRPFEQATLHWLDQAILLIYERQTPADAVIHGKSLTPT